MPPARSSRDVILQVANIEAATSFYEGVLGLEVFERSASIVGFETGGFRLFIEPGRTPEPVFEILVDNVQASKTTLAHAGCVVVDENPMMPRCYLKDPFGLTFNLAQR